MRFKSIKFMIIALQARSRGVTARTRFKDKKRVDAAVVIQSWARSTMAEQNWRRQRKGVVVAQSLLRGKIDRKKVRDEVACPLATSSCKT